ncbi:MAG: MaoC/PaaZ C-terminal domain-containing protein [Acidimicrobiales bacterium]
MAADRLNAGDRAGPYELVLDAGMGAALALATGDSNQRYVEGTALPPTLLATQAYRAQFAAMLELVPEPVFAAARSGVHGQHDLLLHRPVVPGEKLCTVVETHSARAAGDNLRITFLHITTDSNAQLVAEQWWTTVLLGTTANSAGPGLPDYAIAEVDRRSLMAEEVVPVDLEMARRYADVSGDFSDHHFDVEAARRSGYESPFLHGLCTMALCARVVVENMCGGEPSRLRRLAVRFASPAFLDRDLTVRIHPRGEGRCAFEATSGGDTAIRNGFAEVRSLR